jgi:hypothetical protein
LNRVQLTEVIYIAAGRVLACLV